MCQVAHNILLVGQIGLLSKFKKYKKYSSFSWKYKRILRYVFLNFTFGFGNWPRLPHTSLLLSTTSVKTKKNIFMFFLKKVNFTFKSLNLEFDYKVFSWDSQLPDIFWYFWSKPRYIPFIYKIFGGNIW